MRGDPRSPDLACGEACGSADRTELSVFAAQVIEVEEKAVEALAVKTPEHVTIAKKYLAELRKKDPKTVKQAERFFRL